MALLQGAVWEGRRRSERSLLSCWEPSPGDVELGSNNEEGELWEHPGQGDSSEEAVPPSAAAQVCPVCPDASSAALP